MPKSSEMYLNGRDKCSLSFEQPIRDVMTKDNPVAAPIGTNLETDKCILVKHRIEKLPIVDEDFNLRGLITSRISRRMPSIRTLPMIPAAACCAALQLV